MNTYELIHSAFVWAFRCLFILPSGIALYLVMVLFSPFIGTIMLIANNRSEDFFDGMRDIYVNMPYDYFRFCFLGR